MARQPHTPFQFSIPVNRELGNICAAHSTSYPVIFNAQSLCPEPLLKLLAHSIPAETVLTCLEPHVWYI